MVFWDQAGRLHGRSRVQQGSLTDGISANSWSFNAIKTFYKELVRGLPWVPSGDPGDIISALKPLSYPSLHPGSKPINSPKPAQEGTSGEFVKFIPLLLNRFSSLKWSLANLHFRTATMETPSPSQTICSTAPLLWQSEVRKFFLHLFPLLQLKLSTSWPPITSHVEQFTPFPFTATFGILQDCYFSSQPSHPQTTPFLSVFLFSMSLLNFWCFSLPCLQLFPIFVNG